MMNFIRRTHAKINGIIDIISPIARDVKMRDSILKGERKEKVKCID